MPKGVYPHTHLKPKDYPAEMVARVTEMYRAGLTQARIASELGASQKVVWRLMKNHGIVARVAANRDQEGPRSASWKGDAAGYQALHLRVAQLRGKPNACGRCKRNGPGRRYEWANLTGRYEDPEDYERMCVSCHRIYDAQRRAATGERTSPVGRSA
jgi:hypothetical protein